MLAVLFLTALLPGFFAPYDRDALHDPYGKPVLSHPLGTDSIGRDILSVLIFSARTSLTVGLGAAFSATCLGTLVGLAAGYRRGAVDEALMRLTDLFLVLPRLPLLFLLAAYLNPGPVGIIVVLAATSWASTARIVRSVTLSMRETGFVRAARALGAGPLYTMIRHILPNISEVVLAKAMLTAAAAMTAEAGVSFLGLTDPAAMSWGTMIHEAFTGGALVNGAYWWYLPPVVCISVSVSAVLFVGQSVTDIRSAPTAQHGRTPLPSPESVSAPQREFLSVEHVTVDFSDAEGGNHHALADVDFRLPEGGRLALVGHTGSGKSVLLMALLRLLPENASFHGRVYYRGTNLFGLSEKEMARLRGRELAYVPQGAGNAMNPMLSVGFQIAESARIHRGMGRREAFDEAVSLLRAMGIENPEKRAKDYPHRYSGGMMQRALLGTALACGSGFFLVDEPTKGLDPAGREEVFRSLARLDTQTILLVTHDLEFAERFADHVAVLYASRIVESAPKETFFAGPLHPYSKALLEAQPERGLKVPMRMRSFEEENHGAACPFLPWCDEAFSLCSSVPPLVERSGRLIRCWRYGSTSS